MHRRPHVRRAFSVLEAVAVIAMLMAVSAAALIGSGAFTRGAADAKARATLDAAMETLLITAVPYPDDDVAALNAVVGNRAVFVDGASPDAETVSVSVDGPVAGLAVLGADGACWMIRRDFAAADPAPVTLYAVTTTPGSCTGQAARAVTVPVGSPTDGRTWNAVIQLG